MGTPGKWTSYLTMNGWVILDDEGHPLLHTHSDDAGDDVNETVRRHNDTVLKIRVAALRLLDNVSPFISALEVEHGADGEELFGDLAEALGLPRDYGSDTYRARVERDTETET